MIYPVPPVGFHVPKRLLDSFIWNKDNFNEFLNSNPLTTSYGSFMKYAKKSFEILDSIQHPNLYRVYPHKLFCDNQIKNRCITHDDKNIFYIDSIHLSKKGVEMVGKLIIKEIEKIEAKSNYQNIE